MCIVLHERETLCVSLKEKHGLRVFEENVFNYVERNNRRIGKTEQSGASTFCNVA